MIIGLSGRRTDGGSAGAGKDEVARVLAGHGFAVVSLADPIKRTAMEWYDFSVEQLWGSKKEDPDLRYPREHGPYESSSYEGGHSRCACCGWAFDGSFNRPPCYLTPRFALKQMGTEVGRALYSDTWVRIALRTTKVLLDACDTCSPQQYRPQVGLTPLAPLQKRQMHVVIPDVRWPTGNEGKAIRQAGGKLWLVERPGAARTSTSHASESQPTPYDAFDKVIRNDGSLEDLWAQMRALVKEMNHE